MRLTTLGLALALAGCGPSTEAAVIPDSCAPEDRIGTYLTRAEQVSGTCGIFPDTVGRIDDPSFLPSHCASDLPDRWTNDGCKLERAYTCLATDGSGSRQSMVGVTEQQDPSGDLITGMLSMQLTNATGALVCSGTYRLTYTRQ